jgi:hypothetical protein
VIPKDCKRLAEVDFPIAEVSRHAAREKSIRHGHPSTLERVHRAPPMAAVRRLQEPIRAPARLKCHRVAQVAQHYDLCADAMTLPMMVGEESPPYGGRRP